MIVAYRYGSLIYHTSSTCLSRAVILSMGALCLKCNRQTVGLGDRPPDHYVWIEAWARAPGRNSFNQKRLSSLDRWGHP